MNTEELAAARDAAYNDLRQVTPIELYEALLWAYRGANPSFLQGLEIGFKVAQEGGWEQVAPGWLRRARQEKTVADDIKKQL